MANATIMVITTNLFITATIAIITNKEKFIDVAAITVFMDIKIIIIITAYMVITYITCIIAITAIIVKLVIITIVSYKANVI